ncbi:MAG: GNAT family N-acetyltransferase [Spirochaetales bacterium]|nr:GNAT family N-acetyltransferase [Candidatus Physcosoma equi]
MSVRMEVFDRTHMERALSLALREGEKAVTLVPALSSLLSREKVEEELNRLLAEGFGCVLLQENHLLGYILVLPPRYPDEVSREYCSPLGGSAFEEEGLRYLPRVLEEVLAQIGKLGGTGLAVTTIMENRKMEEALLSSRFRKDRVDAIRFIGESTERTAPTSTLEELPYEKTEEIRGLKEKLCAFFASPPILRHTPEAELEAFFSDEEKRVFVERSSSSSIGFFALTKHERNYLTKGIWSSYGLFVDPEARGNGSGKKLLEHALGVLEKEGETVLGTDYNTENKGAELFWNKTFHPYAMTYRKMIME